MKLSYEAVRSILRECGPMTMREVALFFPDVPYLRAVYAIGNKRDAAKPPVISDKERSKTWRARHKVPQVVANSVFTWGQQ